MSGRTTDVLDIRELVRHLQAGASDRQVAQALRMSRKTVSKYRQWAQRHELLAGPLPGPQDLARLAAQERPEPPKATSTVEPYRPVVLDLRERGVEMATIYQRLRDDYGYAGSYGSVYRFVRKLEPRSPEPTIRLERPPGEEAQVDFGYAGLMLDEAGRRRRAWGFLMTLSCSRHQYAEFVFDQKLETWLLLHRHAFEFFGGVTRKVVIDNLKAGITQACWDDPQVQRAYRDLAEYYGFLIAPCRVRQPQEKGKVENGIHYLARSFLAGRDLATLSDNNRAVLEWVEQVAGLRLHGTTKRQPKVHFEQVERAALLPLPATPYELAIWKQIKRLARDGYVQFDRAYYSAPCRLVDQSLWVRGDAKTVRIFTLDHQCVATHPRATEPGQRQTNPNHLPETKAGALSLTAEHCREQAAAIGPQTRQVVEHLLAERPLDRLRSVGKLLRLSQKYGPQRLERACARAGRFDTLTYPSVKRILENHLEAEDEPEAIQLGVNWPQYARTGEELLQGRAEGGE